MGSKVTLGADKFNKATKWLVSGTLLPFPQTLIVSLIAAFSRGEPFVLFRSGGDKAQEDDPKVKYRI